MLPRSNAAAESIRQREVTDIMNAFKKTGLLALSAVMAASCCSVFGACSKAQNDPDTIYVKMYNGGFGTTWLSKAAEEYKELTGTSVSIKTYKNEGMSPANLKSDNSELFFLQDAHYYTYVEAGVLADISDAIRDENPYESDKTVESKLNNDQKEFLQYNGSYYALTHYIGNWGIIYDVELFENNHYYFKRGSDQNETYTGLDDREIRSKFVTGKTDERGYGPDGRTGVEDGIDYSLDDGLPATYADFWILCQRIINTNNIPLVWSGLQRGTYVTSLMTSLISDYLGKEGMLRTFNFKEGETIGELANFDEDGNIQNWNGTATFDGTNGYEIYRQKAYYEGLSFIKELMDNYDKYGNGYGTSDNFVYTDAQDQFIRSVTADQKIAMLIDGQWWENEANATFVAMANSDDKYSRENRRFGWMTLPKANVEKVEEGNRPTLLNTMDALCAVRASVSEEKLDKIIDFIQFLNTDEQLVKFTQETSAMRGLNYTLSEEELAGLTEFSQSVVRYTQNADVLYTESNSTEYRYNLYDTNSYDRYPYNYGSTSALRPTLLFGTASGQNVTAAQYLYRLYTNKKAIWVAADD